METRAATFDGSFAQRGFKVPGVVRAVFPIYRGGHFVCRASLKVPVPPDHKTSSVTVF